MHTNTVESIVGCVKNKRKNIISEHPTGALFAHILNTY